MKGFYFEVDSCSVLYVPFNMIVIDDGENYDVRNKGPEIRLFDRYWDNNQVCLFERGLLNTRTVLQNFVLVDIPHFWTTSHLDHCFSGRSDLADIEAISILESVKEFVNEDARG